MPIMSSDLPEEPYFEVETPLGFSVRVSLAHWQLIATIKHPVMAGREELVRAVLASPDEVHLIRIDESVYSISWSVRDGGSARLRSD
jgi:hypothetical protein